MNNQRKNDNVNLSSSRSLTSALLIALSLLIFGCVLIFLMNMSPQRSAGADSEASASAEQESSYLISSELGNSVSLEGDAETIIVAEVPEISAAVKESPQSRLEKIRYQTAYNKTRMKFVMNIDLQSGFEQRRAEPENPEAFLLLQQWYREDPLALVEAFREDPADLYLEAVLLTELTANTVHILVEYLPGSHSNLFDVGSEFGLHRQVPQLYLDKFRDMSKPGSFEHSVTLTRAAAELHYPSVRNYLIDQAITSEHPAPIFDELIKHGQEDLTAIATKMWTQQSADTTARLRAHRAGLAYRFGVSGSPSILAELLATGAHVNEVIYQHTSVENAVARFPEIFTQLQFNHHAGVWILPAE